MAGRSGHPLVLVSRFLIAISIAYDACIQGVGGTTNDAGNYEFQANQTCSSGQTPCAIPLSDPHPSALYPNAKHVAACSFYNDTHILLANPQYSNLLLFDSSSPSPSPSALFSTANGTSDAGCDPMGAVALPPLGSPSEETAVVNGSTVTTRDDPTHAAFVCPSRGEVWRVDLASGAMRRVARMLGTPDGAFDSAGSDGLDFRGGDPAPQTTFGGNAGRILSEFSGEPVGTSRQPGLDSVAPVGIAASADGHVVWVSNRNRNMIVAVNVSMTEEDLEGCGGGTCVCKNGERAGVCDSADAQTALECCSWRIAISSPLLKFPAGLSRKDSMLASGSWYTSGQVALLRIVGGVLEGSLTMAGAVVTSEGGTLSASDLSAFATAWAPVGTAVYASNEGRIDRIVPSFHAGSGLLASSAVTTVRAGLGSVRALCASPGGDRLAVVEDHGVRLFGTDECNPRFGCSPSQPQP